MCKIQSDYVFRVVSDVEERDYICKDTQDLINTLKSWPNHVFCVQFVSKHEYKECYKVIDEKFFGCIEYEALKRLKKNNDNEKELPFC